MMYYPNVIYHVYNHSNQGQVIFRSAEDYLNFEHKLRTELSQVAEVLCYCLMPTHFHLQILPHLKSCEMTKGNQQRIHALFRSLLSSTTRRLNLKYGGRGSVFRAKTKYKPAYTDFIPDDWEMNEDEPFTRLIPYVKTGFRYIHHNPVQVRLVAEPMQWPYSSALDYGGRRDNGICNYELTEQLIGIRRLRVTGD